MPAKKFDPRKFIDREFEQELFEELLLRKDITRILAIKDAGGMGKSYLLHHFQYRCRTVKPRTPVSLIELDRLPDDSPLALTQQIVQSLEVFSIPFPNFSLYETARKAHDFPAIRGNVDLRGANMSRARVDAAGVMTKIDQAEQVTIASSVSELTPDQEKEAQQKSVHAFLEDLTNYCYQNPAVIMLDAYEKCNPDLQQWLIDHFLNHHCFDLKKRPENLLLVIAGQEVPDFELYWSIEDCEAVVKSVKSLSRWSAENVEECLQVHGFQYTPRELRTFCQMIEIGLSPFQVINGFQSLPAK